MIKTFYTTYGNNNNNSFKNKVTNEYLNTYGHLLGLEPKKSKSLLSEQRELCSILNAIGNSFEKPKPSVCDFCPFGRKEKSCSFNLFDKTRKTEIEQLTELLESLANGEQIKSPDYDFIDIFGKPVKVFKDYIQYGYELINNEDAYVILLNDFNSYKKAAKPKVTKTTELTIKINL